MPEARHAPHLTDMTHDGAVRRRKKGMIRMCGSCPFVCVLGMCTFYRVKVPNPASSGKG